jgi:hypothetical protein
MCPMINTDSLIRVETVRACLDMSKDAGNADLFDLLLDWVKTMGGKKSIYIVASHSVHQYGIICLSLTVGHILILYFPAMALHLSKCTIVSDVTQAYFQLFIKDSMAPSE